MAILRAIAIPSENVPDYSGDVFAMHESDCFRALAVALGFETESLALRLRGYSIRKLEVIPGVIIKAEFDHVRYDIKTRTDAIRTDLVSLVWEPGEGKSWQQLGCVRREIETRTHFKTDAGFEKAVTGILAEHLENTLTGPESGNGNTRPAFSADYIGLELPQSDAGEKKPSNGAKSRKIKKPRHGRGRR